MLTRKFHYIGDMRQRLGLEPDDASHDAEIMQMAPARRLALLTGWHLGDPSWAQTFIAWAEDVGFEIKARR